MQVTVDMWSSVKDLDALLAACSVVCEPMSLLAAAWGIPVVSYTCTSPALSNKLTYPTFTRAIGTGVKFADLIEATMKSFNWSQTSIYGSVGTLYELIAKAIFQRLKQIGMKTFFHLTDTYYNSVYMI